MVGELALVAIVNDIGPPSVRSIHSVSLITMWHISFWVRGQSYQASGICCTGQSSSAGEEESGAGFECFHNCIVAQCPNIEKVQIMSKLQNMPIRSKCGKDVASLEFYLLYFTYMEFCKAHKF